MSGENVNILTKDLHDCIQRNIVTSKRNLSVAEVVGSLEIVKHQVIDDNMYGEYDDDEEQDYPHY